MPWPWDDQHDDPLAGYHPDWRRELQPNYTAALPQQQQLGITPTGQQYADLPSQPTPVADPLADYHPNWRAQVAQTMFGAPEEHQPMDPELLAQVQGSAAAGVNETPFQNAYRELGRVGRQAAVSLPEQVVMGARDVAGTAGAIGTALVDPSEALRGGQQVRELFNPALEELQELAGEPRGAAETAARMIGPLPLIGGVRGIAGRAARGAAEREAMGMMERIHEAPLMGDETQAYRLGSYMEEPRTPNNQAVVSFTQALEDVQGQRAQEEAARAARIDQPRSAIAQAIEDFDRERYAAAARNAPPDPLADYTPAWRDEPPEPPPPPTAGPPPPPPDQPAGGPDLAAGPSWLPHPFRGEAEPNYLDEVGPDGQGGEATVRQMLESRRGLEPTINNQSPERQALRIRLIDDLEERHGWEEASLDDMLPSGRTKREAVMDNPERPEGEPPRAYVILGYPGSGKSTVIADRIFDEHPWARVIDADESKKTLPEYEGGVNADRVHEESSGMNKELLARTIAAGHDIMLPIVGGRPESVKKYLDALAEKGYQVHLAVNEVRKETAVERVLHRWRTRGRFVNPALIFEAGEPSVSYELLRDHPAVTSWERWNNDSPIAEGAQRTEAGTRETFAGPTAEPVYQGGGRTPGGNQEYAVPAPAEAPPAEVAPPGAFSQAFQELQEGPPAPRGTPTRIESNTGATEAEYSVLPAERVAASNIATDLGPFDRHPLHPGNERTYAPGSDQHLGVLRQAAEWNPRLVLNTDPTPVGGPPIVVPWTRELAEATGKDWEDVRGTYWTAGGNSRVMAQDLLRQRGRGAVIDAANRNAAGQFGLAPEEVGQGNLIVRIAREPVTSPAQARALVSRLNEVPTKALGVEEAAVSAGQKMSPETRDWFGSVYDGDKPLRANLQSAAVARELRDRLSRDGVLDASNRARFYRPDGTLTEEGKTFIERMMLGRAVPDATLLQTATPAMVGKIESIATLVDRSGVGGEGYDLRPALAEILRRQGGQNVSLERHLAQMDMLQQPPDELTTNLWRMMDGLSSKELRERLSRYVDVVEKRVVRSAHPEQTGFGLEDPTPIPTAGEAWEQAAAPQGRTFTTMGGGARRGVGGAQILASMAGGGALGAAAGGTQGDTPEERARNAMIGLGAGIVGGGVLGQARGGPFSRALEALQGERGQAGRRPPPGASLFDQDPAQADIFGPRAGDLSSSTVGQRPEGYLSAFERQQAEAELARGGQKITPEEMARRPELRGEEPIAGPTFNERGQGGLFGERGAVGSAARRVEPPREPTPPLEEEPVNPDDYVNVAKFNLDPTGEARLRTEVTRIVQEQGIHPKQVVSWDETRAIANSLGLNDLPKEQLNTRLNGPQMLAIRNIVSTNLEALDRFYGRIKEIPPGDPELARLDRSIGYLERENDALLGRFTRNRTQSGRDLNNLKILANRVMDPFTWIAKAANMAEQAGKKLTVEQRDRIRELVEGGDKAELVNYVSQLRPTSRTNQMISLWKTGLLTNPKTHLANIIGNVAMAGLETAKDLPAAIVDRMLSPLTGQRAKDFSLAGLAKATWRGAKAGAQEAGNIIRNGVPADLSRWEIPNEVTFKNPVLRAYTEIIRRGLGAPDAFFRQVALHRALAEAQRLGPLTEETALQAVADAEYAVFQGGGRQAGVQSRLAQVGEAARRKAGPVGQIVAPFTRTPGNIVSATIDYSPFGAIRGARDVYRLVKAVKAKASPTEIRALQKAASEQIGRTVTGTGAPFVAGYILARNGLMTGARPNKQEEQEQWDLAGKQENAVKVAGRWWSLNRVSPVGNLMALGANYYHLRQNPEAGELGALAGSLGSIGTTATEQSFLRGVQEFNQAITDPWGQAGKYGKNLVASTVPAVVGSIARGVDPVVRDTKGGFLDAFLSRVPGASRSLPAQVDQLGREKERDGGVLAQMFDPTASRPYKLGDPVIRELESTGASLGELNQGRGRPAEVRKLEALLRNTRAPHTKALLERRLEQAKGGEPRERFLVRSRVEGQLLDRHLQTIIQNPNYQGLPLEARKDVLEASIEHFRRQMAALRRKAGL